MQKVATTRELKEIRAKYTSNSVGFVPTMGALHEGHLSLIQRSKVENERTIVSIFVNPTQFGENEDFHLYPRKLEADSEICERAGVDILFIPTPEEIYTRSDEVLIKAPMQKGYILEGAFRPGHFDGMLRVVLKLLGMTQPTRAYFGQKDAQQLILIQQMVQDLFLPYEVVPCPIKRDHNGLALSSRNAYLSATQQQEALKISAALKEASRQILLGERQSQKIKEAALKILAGLEIDYFEIVDRNLNLLPEVILEKSLILVVARVGKVRLLDNLWI